MEFSEKYFLKLNLKRYGLLSEILVTRESPNMVLYHLIEATQTITSQMTNHSQKATFRNTMKVIRLDILLREHFLIEQH